MKENVNTKKSIVLVLSLLLCFSGRAEQTEKVSLGVLPPEACGVWSWYSWGGTPNQWNGKITADETYAGLRGIPIVVGWDKLEPEDGVYNWDLFDDIIKKAAANGKYVFTLLWINPTEPEWLYDKGVPKVEIDTFKDDPNFGIQAYPLDKKYKFYSERIITKLAEHLRSLPPELFKRVVFHQVVEGSTGDGFCYKGEPKDPRYEVTREEWANYQKYIRRFTVDAFSNPMDGKPPMALLIHTEDVAEGLNYYPGTVLKQGVPSHGYGSNTERSKFNGYKPWMTPDNLAGRPVFSRGEGETMIPRKGQTTEHSKWFQQNPQQNLYWTALGALQNGLDIWNLPEFVIEDQQWRESLDIFNRYAGQKYPGKSPVAFCALRDELNADDTTRFPEDKYGAANKKNTDRVLKICAEFADHGAVVQDLDKALAGGLKSRNRTGYNDVAWDRIDEDYGRFLYPIDKLETSVGWWNVGPKDQPYGKFARGFEYKSGKNALYFGFHKDFFKQDGQPVGPLTLRLVWLDNTTGSWGLSYDAGKENFKSAKTFVGQGTGRWREETFTITDATMNHNGPRGADIALVNLDDKDKIFHLIEVQREVTAPRPTASNVTKPIKSAAITETNNSPINN
jgi:hypothetical protein